MNRRVNIQKSGNWSDPELWYGGILPMPTDVVYSNGFEVNIDQDITVSCITNEPTYPDVQAGKFIVNNDVTISADLKCGIDALLNFSGNHLHILGNIHGSDLAGEVTCMENTNTGIIQVSGTIVGGSSGYAYGILNSNSGTIDITGTIGRGRGAYSYAIYNTSNGKIIINGIESTHNGGYGDNPIS